MVTLFLFASFLIPRPIACLIVISAFVVSAKIITDRETGRAKGFAFVEMAEQQHAEKAIKELDGGELDGRNIKVNLAKPKTNNRDRGNRW